MTKFIPWILMIPATLYFGWLGPILVIMMYVCAGFLGRCFVQIPQNNMAGIFLFGLRLSYRVGTQEDLDKFHELPYPNGKMPNGKHVKLLSDPTFGLLKKFFNLGMYSANPLANIRPVKILKRKRRNNTEKRLKDQLSLPEEAELEKFLWIISTQTGFDENVELKGQQTRINVIRLTQIQVTDPDVIYVYENAEFSVFQDQIIEGGNTGYLKTLTYDGFKDGDFTEASTTYDEEIQKRVVGTNGIQVLTISMPSYELSDGQEALFAAQVESQAADMRQQTIVKLATAESKSKALRGRGDAVAVDLRMRAYEKWGVTPDVAAEADAEIIGNRELAGAPNLTTVIKNQGGGGIVPSYAVNVQQPPRSGQGPRNRPRQNQPQQRRNP